MRTIRHLRDVPITRAGMFRDRSTVVDATARWIQKAVNDAARDVELSSRTEPSAADQFYSLPA
jgi:hypothetical protein